MWSILTLGDHWCVGRAVVSLASEGVVSRMWFGLVSVSVYLLILALTGGYWCGVPAGRWFLQTEVSIFWLSCSILTKFIGSYILWQCVRAGSAWCN